MTSKSVGANQSFSKFLGGAASTEPTLTRPLKNIWQEEGLTPSIDVPTRKLSAEY